MTPLVLLPAFPLDAAMYRLLRPLVDIELVTPHLPGFGGVPLPDARPSLNVYGEAVIAELDDLGVERFVLGGTSMGGYTAMAIARRWRQRLAGLVLIDTKASADTEPAAEGRRAMARQMVDANTTAPLIEEVLPRLLGDTTFASRPEVVTLVSRWVRAAPPESAAWAQLAMAARPESFAVLRAMRVPSLVIVGEEDVLSPPSDAAEMTTALPDVEQVVVPAAGHLTPLEAPEAVAVALNAFMARLPTQ